MRRLCRFTSVLVVLALFLATRRVGADVVSDSYLVVDINTETGGMLLRNPGPNVHTFSSYSIRAYDSITLEPVSVFRTPNWFSLADQNLATNCQPGRFWSEFDAGLSGPPPAITSVLRESIYDFTVMGPPVVASCASSLNGNGMLSLGKPLDLSLASSPAARSSGEGGPALKALSSSGLLFDVQVTADLGAASLPIQIYVDGVFQPAIAVPESPVAIAAVLSTVTGLVVARSRRQPPLHERSQACLCDDQGASNSRPGFAR